MPADIVNKHRQLFHSYIVLTFFLIASAILLHASNAYAQIRITPLEDARDKFLLEMILESAYLFYMAAEMAILFFIVKIKLYLQSDSLPDRIHANVRDRRTLLRGTLFVLGAATLLFGRHLFVEPMPSLLSNLQIESARDTAQFVNEAYALRARIHLSVFFIFLNVWMLLEGAIVWHGLGAYRAMKRVLLRCA